MLDPFVVGKLFADRDVHVSAVSVQHELRVNVLPMILAMVSVVASGHVKRALKPLPRSISATRWGCLFVPPRPPP
ncbi:MAG: hypothetical protein KF779_15345 [Hyphomonadaceae bacterium]|nr:hypothetical protein [Hyphomonadaceae bacterium]